MTGGEAVAAAKIVKKLADSLGDDPEERDALIEAATKTPAFAAASETLAIKIAVRQRMSLQLLKPLAVLLRVPNEYFEGQFYADLGERIERIPEQNRQSPPPTTAVPALQGLGWSSEEPDLKQMYLNLLGAACDDRRGPQTHPSFAAIVQQLSPKEAAVLKGVLSGSPHIKPIIRLRLERDGQRGFEPMHPHVMPIGVTGTTELHLLSLSETAMFVENWSRLGLVSFSYDEWLANDTAYDWCGNHIHVQQWIASAPQGQSRSYDRGTLTITEFGQRFAQAVLGLPDVIRLY